MSMEHLWNVNWQGKNEFGEIADPMPHFPSYIPHDLACDGNTRHWPPETWHSLLLVIMPVCLHCLELCWLCDFYDWMLHHTVLLKYVNGSGEVRRTAAQWDACYSQKGSYIHYCVSKSCSGPLNISKLVLVIHAQTHTGVHGSSFNKIWNLWQTDGISQYQISCQGIQQFSTDEMETDRQMYWWAWRS